MDDDKLDDLDLLLKEVYKKHKDRLDNSITIVVPSADQVLKGYRQRLTANKETNRTSRFENSSKWHFFNMFIKVAAVAFFLICTSLIYSLATSTNEAKAIKFNVIKTLVQIKDNAINITHSNKGSDSISGRAPINIDTKGDSTDMIEEKLSLDQIRSKLGSVLVVPKYIPQGYTLIESDLTRIKDTTNIIKQVYKNESGSSYFIFKQTTGQNNVNLKTVTPKGNSIKQYTAMGEDCVVISSDQNSFQAMWFKDDCKFDLICNTINENEVLKIIDNIKVPD